MEPTAPNEQPQAATPARAEFTPNRQPQELSKNFDTRVGQLLTIAEKPSKEQVEVVAAKIRPEVPDGDEKTLNRLARERLKGLTALVNSREDAEAAVIRTRSEQRAAIKASPDEYARAKQAHRDAVANRVIEREILRDEANFLTSTGVKLEPNQQTAGVGENVQRAAFNVKRGAGERAQAIAGGVRAGTEAAVRGVRSGTEAVQGGVRAIDTSVSEAARERGEQIDQMFEAGRARLRTAVEGARNNVRSALSHGREGWNKVTSGVGAAIATADKGPGLLSRGLDALGAKLGKGAERVGQTRAWTATEAWVNSRTTAAGARVDAFLGGMKELGQGIGQGISKDTSEGSRALNNFLREQERRAMEVDVAGRVGKELRSAYEAGKAHLTPAWEAIQAERPVVRRNASIMADQLGLVLEEVHEFAAPVIDPILDRGRDVRDAALGLSRRTISGMRAFGRMVGGKIETNPVLNALTERWESMRSRSNEARTRLNVFLNANRGNVSGAVFNMLRESARAHTSRDSFLGELGRGIGTDLATAREVLKRGAERAAFGVEVTRRFIEVSAVGRWIESGMKGPDVARRLKVLRAAGAVSAAYAEKAGLLAAATVVEVAANPNARKVVGVGLGVASLAAMAINAPHVIDGLNSFLQAGGIPNFDLASAFPNIQFGGGEAIPGAEAAAPVPGTEAIIGGSPPTGVESVGSLGPTGPAGPFVGGAEAGVPNVAPVAGPEVAAPVPEANAVTSAGAENATPPAAEAAAIPQTPDQATSQIQVGQPIEAQARTIAPTLPGNPTDNYYRLLEDSFQRFADNFQSTANAMVTAAPGTYDTTQVSQAQDQLNAISQLRQGLVDASTQEGYNLLMRAMHFGRPA